MVFGRFAGSKALDRQRDELEEVRAILIEHEAVLRKLGELRALSGEAWQEGEKYETLVHRSVKAREAFDAFELRALGATAELANFSEPLQQYRTILVRDFDAVWTLDAMLFARKLLLAQAGRGFTTSPSVLDCQKALHSTARGLQAALASHVVELHGVKAGFSDPWPEMLDLDAMERGLKDTADALALYGERLADAAVGEQLPDTSTNTIFKMVLMLQNSIGIVERERPIIALTIAASAVMKIDGTV